MSTPMPPVPVRRNLTPQEYAEGVVGKSRTILARAITLIESNAPVHAPQAEELMRLVMPHVGGAIRVGITGVPGVGKSTFIESFGCKLCDDGHKVAVLAIDPSSTLTRGSILGDKTRMERLSNHPNSFIRPSPSSGALGGVARKTRETMFLCEAAGYDVILIETVGVGQSETVVRSMVDFFLLLALAGAGDELQGIKKGIVELADAITVTKADGDNEIKAEVARQEYVNALHNLKPATPNWTPRVMTCSSKTLAGMDKVWNCIMEFQGMAESSGYLSRRRSQQLVEWVHSMAEDRLLQEFMHDPAVVKLWPEIEQKVSGGELASTEGVRQLLQVFLKERAFEGK